MSYIGQAPGLGQRSLFRFVSLAGQTVFSGRDANGLVLNYTPGPATLVMVGGLMLSGPDYTATDGSILTIASPLPAGKEVLVLVDAAWNPANTYTVDAADVKFTRKRNRIVNPGMRINQEKSGAATNVTNAAVVFPVDGWSVQHADPTVVLSTQQVAKTTPGGSPNRLRTTVSTPNATMPGYVTLSQVIEGVEMGDMRFGSAAAKSFTYRMGFNFPAGTYSVCFRNESYTRCYTVPLVVSPAQAGTDQLAVFTIPGDLTGTWNTSTGRGLEILVFFASAVSGAPYAWTAGGAFGVAGQSNGVATAGSVYEVFDCGIYEGSIAPSFELPEYAEDLRKCRRYWQKCTIRLAVTPSTSPTNAYVIGLQKHPVPMRIDPSMSYTDTVGGNPGTLQVGLTTNIPPSSGGLQASSEYLLVDVILGTNYYTWAQAYVTLNARL